MINTDHFLPGLELSRRFYFEAVRPILTQHFPDLPHCAARIGYGSEVLGFDTPMSMDHDWHPRVDLFLREEDLPRAETIRQRLADHLPHTFLGIPVDAVPVPDESGVRVMNAQDSGPVEHVIAPTNLKEFVQRRTGWNIFQPLETADWLSLPSQTLRELTAGEIFHDDLGELTRLREELIWYPQDVWLYLLASGWNEIEQEEHLMPRAGFTGDELGSAVIGARLVNRIMRQCFLMEKRYAPYPKWLGSDFQHLKCAEEMTPHLRHVKQAQAWQPRQAAFGQACLLLADMHNELGLTPPIPAELSNFHNRPFPVIHSDRFAIALREQIQDVHLRRFAEKGLIGNIDQISENAELKSNIATWRERIRKLYE